MDSLLLVSDPTALMILGFGAVLLGLALLGMGRWPQSYRNRILILCFGLLACAALASPLLTYLAPYRLPLLVLAGITAVPLLVTGRSGKLMTAGFALLRDPRVQGALLLLVVPMIALGWSWQVERHAAPTLDPGSLLLHDSQSPSRSQNRYAARTDSGRELPIFAATPEDMRSITPTEETHLMQSRGLALHLIRTAEADRGSNSHGWIFTGGQFCIVGVDVATILRDNDYHTVSDPRVGDLVIYRDSAGTIVHSAVVRVVRGSDMVLLQSKWAQLGCYLHQPQDYPLASSWTFYRSPRTGHVLHDLPQETSDASPMPH